MLPCEASWLNDEYPIARGTFQQAGNDNRLRGTGCRAWNAGYPPACPTLCVLAGRRGRTIYVPSSSKPRAR